MKFSLLSVLVAVFLFDVAAAVVAVEATTRDETSDGPGRPPRRTLVSKKTTTGAVPAPAPPPKLLFVQAGTDCVLNPSATKSGEYLFRATVGTATTFFSERPDRLADTMTTEAFQNQFDHFFVASNPNVAITFSGDNSNTGPLIGVLSRPRMVDSSIMEYTMSQSESQAKVASIDQFLKTSGSCSIFIDADDNTCVVASGQYSGNSKYPKEYYNEGTLNNPYETCFSKNNMGVVSNTPGATDPNDYCWSHSYYDGGDSGWQPCKPKGFGSAAGSVWGYDEYGDFDDEQGDELCGAPCNEFTAATAAAEDALAISGFF